MPSLNHPNKLVGKSAIREKQQHRKVLQLKAKRELTDAQLIQMAESYADRAMANALIGKTLDRILNNTEDTSNIFHF